ncbi:MAG: Do family serine endopeptidase [Acidobacteriota bacterium]
MSICSRAGIRHFRSVMLANAFILLGIFGATLSAQPEKVAKTFTDIAKKVEPAVVSIDTKGKTPQVAAKESVPPSDGSDIMEFLRKQMQQRPVHSVGSGFIVDKTGYIVTNAHVIEDAARITVKLDSGEEFNARVIGSDDQTDLAILKIDAPRDLAFVKFGDSDKAEVGDWVLAIGSPFGLTKTVTAGIISQTRRETPYATAFQRFIQTDAAINRGNSGGPLVNLDGEVIGINSQIATSTGDYNGIGFALPSRDAENVYGQIVKSGKVRRGYLGVVLDSVKTEFASVYGLKDAKGAIVTDIRDKQGPAATAGLQVGDVVVEFNGKPVDSAQDLIAKVAATSPEQTVTVGYLRESGTNFDPKTATIRLSERPTARNPDDDKSERRVLPIDGAKVVAKPFGLTLSELNPVLTEKYKTGTQKGLIVKDINPASFIADVKDSFGADALGEGDLIQKINRVSVTDLKTFNETVSKLKVGDAVVLNVLTYNPQTASLQLKIVQFTVK